jgi:hypothetical protein
MTLKILLGDGKRTEDLAVDRARAVLAELEGKE